MTKLIKVLEFLYFLLIVGVSIAIAAWTQFFVVGIIAFAILIEPIMRR